MISDECHVGEAASQACIPRPWALCCGALQQGGGGLSPETDLPLPALSVHGGHMPDFKDSVLQMQDFSNVYVHHKLQ